jgi:hypothetical protein
VNSTKVIPCLILFTCICYPVKGLESERILNRTTLFGLDGAQLKQEDFEKTVVPGRPFGQVALGPILNSETVFQGKGPGIVVPGVTFKTQTDIMLLGPLITGGTSQQLTYSSGNPFTIEFSPPVQLVGVDLFAIQANSGRSRINIFDVSNNLIADFSITGINSPTIPSFLGYRHDEGIKRILVSTFIGGPCFDNLAFGRIVPEPTTFCLLIVSSVGAVMNSMVTRRIGR